MGERYKLYAFFFVIVDEAFEATSQAETYYAFRNQNSRAHQ
jgi:hypothetical protein